MEDYDYNDNNNDADNNAGDFDYYSTVNKNEFSKNNYKSVAKKTKADLTNFLIFEAQKQPITPRPKLRKRGVQTNIDILKKDGNWIELYADAVEKPVFKSAIKDQLVEVASAYENISLIFAPKNLVESFRRYRNGAQNRVQETLF